MKHRHAHVGAEPVDGAPGSTKTARGLRPDMGLGVDQLARQLVELIAPKDGQAEVVHTR